MIFKMKISAVFLNEFILIDAAVISLIIKFTVQVLRSYAYKSKFIFTAIPPIGEITFDVRVLELYDMA